MVATVCLDQVEERASWNRKPVYRDGQPLHQRMVGRAGVSPIKFDFEPVEVGQSVARNFIAQIVHETSKPVKVEEVAPGISRKKECGHGKVFILGLYHHPVLTWYGAFGVAGRIYSYNRIGIVVARAQYSEAPVGSVAYISVHMPELDGSARNGFAKGEPRLSGIRRPLIRRRQTKCAGHAWPYVDNAPGRFRV